MNLVYADTKHRESFSLKFFAVFSVFIAIISVSLTAFFYQQQRLALTNEITGKGALLAKLLAHHSRLGVFAESPYMLNDPIEGILQHEEILLVSVLTAEGKLLGEQPNARLLHRPGLTIPNWNTRLTQVQASGTPHVFGGKEYYEFWAPITSSTSFTSSDPLYLATPNSSTAKPIGYVRIIVDRAPLTSKLESLLATSIAIAVTFLTLGILATYLIVRGITKPLNRLTEGVRALEMGKPFQPIDVKKNDEIGRLTTAFNHMAATLRQREEEKELLSEELRQAQKMEAIGTLAGGVAHDFNNILTAIIGFGTLLQRSLKGDNPYRVYVDQILTAADRAATLVKRLLAFGRKQIISLRPTNLNDVVRSIEKLLGRLITEDIELRLNLSAESLVALADSGQIDQILMNLVTNARDAMPDGGVLTIETGSELLDEGFCGTAEALKPGHYGIISVTDTGMGIDEKTRERIFDPFFTTKEVGKGTGLGLSMVYGIVKQHEGCITVESEPGKGTVFRIYLPLVQTLKAHPPMLAQVVPAGNSETVLLAEDDRAVRKLAKHVLERSGYSVIEADDGAEAVKRFTEISDRIDLVLLDVVMPKKNGQAVYDEIRQIRPDIKVLFISGYTQDIISRKGVIEQNIDFIAKPVKPDELLTKVRDVLQK